jgi:hypothetical protein
VIEKGICPECNKGPRDLRCRHPDTQQWICGTCHRRATAMGICPECKKGPKALCYLHPETRQHICHGCFARIKRRERGPRRVSKKPAKSVAVKKHRRNLYPTKESVIEALETRTKSGKKNNAAILYSQDATLYRRARKFGVSLPRSGYARTKLTTRKRVEKSVRLHETHKKRPVILSLMTEEDAKRLRKGLELKYSTRAAVIRALEDREAQGKNNLSYILRLEDIILYYSAQMFEVELPIEENHRPRYFLGDWVQNQNLKDPDIYGKIGKVVESSEEETRVNFRERGGVTRVYKRYENLNNIILHVRLSCLFLVLLRTAKEK